MRLLIAASIATLALALCVPVLTGAGPASAASNAPAITSVSYRGGSTSGGAYLTLRGARFTRTTKVYFGSSAATVSYVSSTTLGLKSPRHAAGRVDIRAVSSYGWSPLTTADHYTYLPGKVLFYDDFRGTVLGSSWAVISRHGEYAQQETECNARSQVAVRELVTITAVAKSTSCGDYNIDGSVRTRAAAWPYLTGDIQWLSFSYTYGTLTYRAKFPPKDTSTWPAIWLFGKNCQKTNIHTASVNYAGCPQLGSNGYVEIDTTECYGGNWCQLALSQHGSFPHCDYHRPTDANWHTYTVVWKPGSVTVAVDGVSTGCSYTAAGGYSVPSTPMFLIMQIQTGGVGGTPKNLPTTLQVSSVAVTQP